MENDFSRTGFALEMAFSFPSRSVVAALDNVAAVYGYPKYLHVDNETELTSKLMQQWSEEHDVELLLIQPGKPTQNAFIGSFNNRVRTELLNARWFHTLIEAHATGYAWVHRYNTTHAHSALGYRTPEEFVATYETTQPPQESPTSWRGRDQAVTGGRNLPFQRWEPNADWICIRLDALRWQHLGR